MKESAATAPSGGLHVIVSNRLENLGAALADLLRAPQCKASQGAVLRPETIVVQSKGMQRWLSLQIARRNGICANLQFPFPNAFLEDLYRRFIGPLPQHYAYEPSVMAFRIMRLLPTLLPRPIFAQLRHYFQAHAHPLKPYQLACQIADLFDQYIIYRPEVLAAWEAGRSVQVAPSAQWQGALWQAVKREAGSLHRGDLQSELIGRLQDISFDSTGLPLRVFVFGISHLPPFHLHVLKALSVRIPVWVLVSNPCREFWFDIVSDHQLARTQPEEAGGAPDLHYERGNRLLASWGRMGRYFFNMLHECEPQTIELFTEDSENSLLRRLQKDILDLVDRPPGSKVECPADGTILIQCCHSAMREVEVLHDRLLSLFDKYDDLTPADVLVMMPDINGYAPYIHAVFGASQLLPYSVADQTVKRQNRTLEAFFQLLDVYDSRFEAGKITSLLEFDVIRERFDLELSELPLIEQWIRETNIRWGWDGPDRKKQALPGFSENSWRSGLDRLLMGYAMMPEGERLCQAILPFESIEGSASRILGSLVVFAETLYEAQRVLPSKATLQTWSRLLSDWIDRFFHENSDSAGDILLLRNVLHRLVELAEISNYDEEVSFEVVRRHIQDSLDRVTSSTGFMVGGITFCAMLPMRSIPSQIICILGLQHDAFPQDLHEPKFNLLAAAPKPGDRSKRNDDKYLFLEALVSARRAFYLSYVGRGIQDNGIVPPSVLIDELIEYICENYTVSKDQLVTNHPLHAFSPAYFNNHNPNLFSYSQENLTAACKIGAPGISRTFFEKDLPEPPETWRRVDLKLLVDFLCHPARHLLERRMGVRLQAAEKDIDHREAFNLDPLDRFLVEQKVVRDLMAGLSPQTSYASLRAAGVLPHGAPGKVLFDRAASESSAFVELLRSFVANETARSSSVDIALNPFTVYGEIGHVFSKGLVMFRMGKIRPRDLLSVFMNHLLLNTTPPRNRSITSFLVAKETIWQFGGISDPNALLKMYLELYWRGLKRPLRFFPNTSFAFARQCLIKNMPVVKAMKAARSKWHSSDYGTGEAADPYISCFFNEDEGLTADFQDLSLAIFQPLLEAGHLIE